MILLQASQNILWTCCGLSLMMSSGGLQIQHKSQTQATDKLGTQMFTIIVCY